MNHVSERYRPGRSPSPSHCEPKPEPCSTCGRLECLCRPRFFAGQILTADDLNRLDAYIRGKNRLHNRQLHGWGVVNGLEVSCDACGPGVVVGCGYALDPCGEDIVVCEPVVVDVCALIKQCRGHEQLPCDPPRHPTPAGCEEGDEEWILAIRYSESPTRAVKPMMADAGCSCGFGGGGKCTCGAAAPQKRPRNAPLQCEPTVVCEGYDFAVYRKPVEPPERDERRQAMTPDSDLYKRFQCCTEALVERMPQMPGQPSVDAVQQNPTVWRNWVCAFKHYLQAYLSAKPGYNCELLARLNAVVCPPLTDTQADAALILQTAVLLFAIWLDALLACFCSALLPPCPVAHPDGLVPLASVRVSGTQCRVLSICNWTRHRKFATTFPALQYWLSILPFGVELRRLIERMCCFQINAFVPQPPGTVDTAAGAPPAPEAVHTAGNASMFASIEPHLFERAFRKLNPDVANPERLQAASGLAAAALMRGGEALDPQLLIESAFLAAKDRGDAHLSAAELANLPQFLALNQLLRPLATGTIGAPVPDLTGRGGGEDLDAIRREMAAMSAAIEKQAEEIRSLREAARRRKEK